MKEWPSMTDTLGPEKILHVHDPLSGMRGVVVVDTTMGGIAAGGTRMMPDITTEEIFGLARAMTYKFTTLELPIGGCKAGIWADPGLKGEARKTIITAFGRAVKPLLESGIALGADIGTDADDVACLFESAGRPSGSTGLTAVEIDGEPLENLATGYGVFVSAMAACEVLETTIDECSVAIEGFGKVGGGVARYMAQAGAKITAISTLHGTLYNPDGLDVEKLLHMRKEWGDKVIEKYERGELMPAEKLFGLPVNILIPGARPYVIHKDNVDQIQASIISSSANIPITGDAEEILFQKKIYSVPDFISNAGGVVVSTIDVLGGKPDDVFSALDHLLKPLTVEILTDAFQEGINPRQLAISRAIKKVLEARKTQEPPDLEELLKNLKARFNLS